jgi:diguanylate cyclase (GGDEF)-like protein/PAS domain S-box-containing protein
MIGNDGRPVLGTAGASLRDAYDQQAAMLRRFLLTLDTSPDLILMWSLSGEIVYANPAAIQTLRGLTRRQGMHLLRFVEREDMHRLRYEVIPAVIEHGLWQGETVLRAAGRENWPVKLTITVQRDQFEYPEVFVATAQDLSAEHTMRTAMAEREALHRAVIDSLAEGVLVQDRNGEVVAWNDSALRILGVASEQLAQENFLSELDATHRDGRTMLPEEFPIVRARTESERIDSFPMRIMAGDGTVRSLSVNARPMFTGDLDDRPGGVATFRDVSQQEALAEEMERLSVIVRQSDHAVIVTTPNARIVWVNDAFTALTGYSWADALGASPGKLLQGVHTSRDTVARIREAVQQGASFTGEILNYKKSGDPYWVELSITPLRDTHGTLTGFVGLSRDVTARRVAERERQTLAAALAVTADGIAIVDAAGALEFVNDAFARMLGDRATAFQGRTWLTLYDEATAQMLTQQVRAAVTPLGFWNGEVLARRLDQTTFPQELSITALPQGGMVVVVRDISDRKAHEQKLRELSIRDELTGLLNRRGFMETARPLIAGALRAGEPCAMLYGDLDRFKQINDVHGHACGDLALQEIARLLQRTFRDADVVARLGGDEFTVLAPGLGADDVPGLLERLERAMAAHNASRADDASQNWVLGMSLGVAWAEAGDSNDVEALLKRADAAQYAVKKSRRASRPA